MAEAQMVQLARTLGRETSHDLVYEAVQSARSEHRILQETLPQGLIEHGVADQLPAPIRPPDYLGEAEAIVAKGVRRWNAAAAASATPALAELANAPDGDTCC